MSGCGNMAMFVISVKRVAVKKRAEKTMQIANGVIAVKSGKGLIIVHSYHHNNTELLQRPYYRPYKPIPYF